MGFSISILFYLCPENSPHTLHSIPRIMQTLVFATNNAHKAREVEQILGPGYSVKTLRDIGCTEEIEETESTLEGNALLKARYVRENFGYDCFSEDTGLEVTALAGAPGVHTARYAGESRDPDANMNLLLGNLEDKPDRSARFRTVIALVRDKKEILIEGICNGRIATSKIGDKGFGYDPVFIPEGYDLTFAELGDDVKNVISHRARATLKLKELLLKE
jgi:XTP/dITP diphosphohydrolase